MVKMNDGRASFEILVHRSFAMDLFAFRMDEARNE